MVIVGFVTLVIRRVDSVTSTLVRSFLGDIRTFSGPMVPGSSGGLPGQSSMNWGLPPAGADGQMQMSSKRVVARDLIRHLRRDVKDSGNTNRQGGSMHSIAGDYADISV